MEKVQVFLDAFGVALNNSSDYSHFVYTALVVAEDQAEALENAAQSICSSDLNYNALLGDNFGANPDDWARRLDYLARLKKYPFSVVSLVVSRNEIVGDHLQQSKIFQKYFHRIFVEKIARNFSAFEIQAASHLAPEFLRELQFYIDANGTQRDLFNPDRYFKLVPPSQSLPLAAVANFLANTVGQIYCVSHQAEDFHQAFELVSDRLMVEFFPFQRDNFLSQSQVETSQQDRAIANIAVQEFVDFIDEHGKKPRLLECLEIAKYLLLIFKSAPHKLISTKELISVVKKKTRQYSQDQLRQHIAQLRDFGLLIVSPQGRYGYKIPNGTADMIGFYNRYYSNIRPMLQRVQRSNQKLQLKTAGQVNILGLMEHFRHLQQLIEVLQRAEIGVARSA